MWILCYCIEYNRNQGKRNITLPRAGGRGFWTWHWKSPIVSGIKCLDLGEWNLLGETAEFFFFFFIVMGFVIHWNEKKLLNSLGGQHQGGRRFWCTPCSPSVMSSIQTPHADIPLPNAQGTLQNSQGRRRHPDWQRSCGRKALSIGGLVRQETHFYYMFNEFQLWLFVLFLSATLSHLQI